MNENFDFPSKPFNQENINDQSKGLLEDKKLTDKDQEKFNKVFNDMKTGMQESENKQLSIKQVFGEKEIKVEKGQKTDHAAKILLKSENTSRPEGSSYQKEYNTALEQLQKQRIKIKEITKASDYEYKLALNAFQQMVVIKLMNEQTSLPQDIKEVIKNVKSDYKKKYGNEKPYDGDTKYLVAKSYAELSEAHLHTIAFIKDKFSNENLTLQKERIARRLGKLDEFSQNITELESLKKAEGPDFKRSISFADRVYVPYSLPKNDEELHTLISSLDANPINPTDGFVVITKPGHQPFPFWENKVEFKKGDSLKLIEETVLAEAPEKTTEEQDSEKTNKERIIERTLEYTDHEGNTKQYLQIHYENWPDTGEPNQELFTRLQESTRLLTGKGTPVGICCETGKGPSAALIASIELNDIVHKNLSKFDDPNEVDLPVAQTVLEMRMQVPGMFEKAEDLVAVYGNLKFQREQLSVPIPPKKTKVAPSQPKKVQFKP